MSKELSRHSQRHLAFISLALGFLVVWTAVLAGVLISKTLKVSVINSNKLTKIKNRSPSLSPTPLGANESLMS